MVHPSGNELRDYIDEKIIDSVIKDQISSHIADCEFCREICENYQLRKRLERQTEEISPSSGATALADRLFESALRSVNIELIPMPIERPASYHMAADGRSDKSGKVINLGTFYSEKPEMILRIMRDFDKGADYLQLTGDEPNLVSNILLNLPDYNREFITDDFGRATIDTPLPQTIESLKWQIKLPEASFQFEPLKYDPEAVKYQSDIILETDRHDRIKVVFEGKTEGKEIKITILSLDGKTDFETVKVMVGQKSGQLLKKVSPAESVSFEIKEPEKEIKIRIFQ